MNTESPLQPDISSDESLLIEYLDGELTQGDRRRVEDRLAKEPELRKALAKLEESWRCLDLLETYSTDQDLLETTLETVILVTARAISEQTKAVRRRFSWSSIIQPLILLLLFAVGIFVGGRLAPDKNFFLRVASPIIERLDMYLLMYEQAPELLPLLAQHRVFLPPIDRVPVDPNAYWPSPSGKMAFPNSREMRRHIDQMNSLDDTLLRQIYYNNEKFNDYPMERRLRLREFHERIELSPQRGELLQTLEGYYNWLKSLQSYEREEIRQPRLSVEERVELIASMKRRLEMNPDVSVVNPLYENEQDRSTLEDLAEVLENLDWQHREYVLHLPPEQAIRYLTRLHQQE